MRSLLSKRKVLFNILTIFIFIFITNIFMVDFKAGNLVVETDKYGKYFTGTLKTYYYDSTTYDENLISDDDVLTTAQARRYSNCENLAYYYINSNYLSKNSILKAAKSSFISELDTSGKTQTEICKLVHDKLISSVTYELSDNSQSMVFSAYGALVDHKAVCEGIAAAYDIIMDYYGIESLIITGEAVGTDNPSNLVNHAWNMVKLDGEWYEIDCTWDLGSSDFTRGTLSYDYFLKTTSYMTSKNHKRTYLGTYLPTANGTKYAYTGESYNKNSIENTYGYPGILEDGLTDDELASYYYYPYGSTYTYNGVTYKIGKKATCEVIKVENRKEIEILNGIYAIKTTSIKSDAFKGCTKLKSLTIGAKYLNKIPSKMLVKCKKLKEFTLFTGKATSYSLKKVPKNLFNSKVKDKVKIWIGCDKSTKKTVYKKLRKLFIKAGYSKKKIAWLQTRTE